MSANVLCIVLGFVIGLSVALLWAHRRTMKKDHVVSLIRETVEMIELQNEYVDHPPVGHWWQFYSDEEAAGRKEAYEISKGIVTEFAEKALKTKVTDKQKGEALLDE